MLTFSRGIEMEVWLEMDPKIYQAINREKNFVIFFSLFLLVYFIQSLHCTISEIIVTILENITIFFRPELMEGCKRPFNIHGIF